MAFLTPDSVYTIKIGEETRTVNVKIIPDGATAEKNIASYIQKGDLVKPNRKLSDGSGIPRGITVHNTNDIVAATGTNPAEQYARATYPNGNMNGVVVHYWVWENEIWQQLSDNEQGWHAADGKSRTESHIAGKEIGGNVDTIAVEIIQSERNEKTEKTAAILIAYLLDKHGLSPETDIYTHNYFYSNKYCPSVLLPVWNEFSNEIKSFYNALTSLQENVSADDKETNKEFSVGDIVNFNGGNVYISSTETSAAGNSKACTAKITLTAFSAAHPLHLRAVNENGDFVSGVYGWVDVSTVKPRETTSSTSKEEENVEEKTPETEQKAFAAGDIVSVKSDSVEYYPGGVKIPSWVKTDYFYEISQVTYRGQKMIKGGKECVLLGRKVDKNTGEKYSSINSWISTELIKAEK